MSRQKRTHAREQTKTFSEQSPRPQNINFLSDFTSFTSRILVVGLCCVTTSVIWRDVRACGPPQMQQAAGQVKRPDGLPSALRIGIHSGPLVAGTTEPCWAFKM